MNSFQYYFDTKFLSNEFDSFFSKQIIDEHKENEGVAIDPVINEIKKRYVPIIIEASTLEFKRTKYNNRNVPNKKGTKRKKK